MSKEINVELLLGKKVFGLNNQRVGRIEEFAAELSDGNCYITEYHVGSYALFERVAALSIARPILSLLGSWIKKSYAIPWNKLDLSDPSHPKLTCPVAKLKRLEE